MTRFCWWRPRERRQVEDTAEDVVPDWPSVSDEVTISLPSVDDLLNFEANVVVEAKWVAAEPPPSFLLHLARECITQRAEKLGSNRTLTEVERLRDEVTTALFQWEPALDGTLLTHGHCTSINVDAELAAAVAARQEAARRRTALSWQDEQRLHQLEHMRLLLLDPLRATASWFFDNQDNPRQLAEVAKEFQGVRDLLAPEDTPDSPGKLVDEILAISDAAVRMRLLTSLSKFFTQHGKDDLAIRLRNIDEDAERIGTT